MVRVIIVGLVSGGSIAVLLAALILMRLRAYVTVRDPERSEADRFSILRYQPLVRLLAEEDFNFLAAQPGYRPEIGVRLRRERRRIFRLYLRELARDFHRLHAEAREMVANSQEQHAGLVGLLIRQQVTFWCVMAAIEIRLLAERAGLGKVDVRGLVEAVEAMRLDLARFAPAVP